MLGCKTGNLVKKQISIKNKVKNKTLTKMDGEQSANNAAAAPKPSPVKQNRPLPAQPKPALAKLAPPTLRPKADGEDEHSS